MQHLYYNKHGQPIDIYGRLLDPQVVPPFQRIQQQQPEVKEWDLNLTEPKTTDNFIKFEQIDDTTNVQELRNKEARLGDTLYFYNPKTGEIYKKYVDFMTGLMEVEKAQFEKVNQGEKEEKVLADPRIDELSEQFKRLEEEVKELKESKEPKEKRVKNDNKDNS